METIDSLSAWVEEHFHELEALVLDIDGVLLMEQRPTPRSRELLRRLRQRGIPFCLLTNDSNHSIEEKNRILNQSGIPVEPQEIISSGSCLVETIEENNLTGERFFVMGDLGRPCFAEGAGLEVTRDLDQILTCQGVIVGENHYDWESVINGVANFFLHRPNARFFVPNPDEFYPKAGGRIHIGAGGVARFIQRVLATYGICIEPCYLGKPYHPIFMHNHHRLEQRLGNPVSRRNVLMIGDFLDSDIRGANDFGYRSGLLLSCTTNVSKLEKSQVQPSLVFQSL